MIRSKLGAELAKNLTSYIAQNVDAWSRLLGYLAAHRTLMMGYSLESTEFLVGPGHYGSAILIEGLGHFAERVLVQTIAVMNYEVGETVSFFYTGEMQNVTRRYYGEKVCCDAMSNPDTEHTTAKGLLLRSGFWITYTRIDETILGGMIENFWIRKGKGDDIDLKDPRVYDTLGLVISLLINPPFKYPPHTARSHAGSTPSPLRVFFVWSA